MNKKFSRDLRGPLIGGGVATLLCAHILSAQAEENQSKPNPSADKNSVQHGAACWHRGTNRTSDGGRWISEDFMAAHRSLPFGTKVRVVNLKNGKSTVVRITDRGPHVRGRIIDVSPAAAREIGILETGVAKVRVEIIRSEADSAEIASKPAA